MPDPGHLLPQSLQKLLGGIWSSQEPDQSTSNSCPDRQGTEKPRKVRDKEIEVIHAGSVTPNGHLGVQKQLAIEVQLHEQSDTHKISPSQTREIGREPNLDARLERVQRVRARDRQAGNMMATAYERSARDARLLGSEIVPADAQPFQMPGRTGRSEPRNRYTKSTAQVKPYKSAYKPVNTLGGPPFMSSPQGSWTGLRTPRNPLHSESVGVPEDEIANVRQSSARLPPRGDGFDLAEREPKRQKFGPALGLTQHSLARSGSAARPIHTVPGTNGNANTSAQQVTLARKGPVSTGRHIVQGRNDVPVDLTDDEYRHVPGGEISDLNGEPVTTADKVVTELLRPLAQQMSEAVHPQMYAEDRRPRRRQPGINPHRVGNSSQGQGQDSSSLLQADIRGEMATTNPQGYSNTHFSDSTNLGTRSKEKPDPHDGNTIPLILLGEGVDLAKKIKRSIEVSNSRSTKPYTSRADIVDCTQPTTRGSPRGSRATQSDVTSNEYAPSRVRTSPEQPLRKQFQRDVGHEPLKTRLKVRERMRVDGGVLDSRVSPIGESDDELAGGNTEPRRGSQSISPRKHMIPGSRVLQLPLTELQATASTKSKRSPIVAETQSPLQSDGDRVPILAFLSLSCMIYDTDGLSLRWDADDQAIDLYEGDQPVVVNGKRQVVSLKARDLSKIEFAKGVNRMLISGSMHETSNGKTCIHLADAGVERFFHLASAVNEHVQVVSSDDHRMNLIFERRLAELNEVYKRKRSSLTQPTPKDPKSVQVPDKSAKEENILYEDVEEAPRPSKLTARERMRHDDLLKGTHALTRRPDPPPRHSQGSTTSPYFDDVSQRSSRQRRLTRKSPTPPPPERWTKVNEPRKWSQPVLYPPQGGFNTATVEFGDLSHLDEGQFLNDNIIAFALRQIQDKINPEYREQVHFFNSFFYNTLTSRNGRRSTCNYDAVKRWTRKSDIMSKPFIVVPINLNLHWFVTIICNVDQLPRKPAGLGHEVVDVTAENIASEDQRHPSVVVDLADDLPPEVIQSAAVRTQVLESSSIVQKNDSEEATEPTVKKKSKKKTAPQRWKYSVDQPIILTLDSLGASHSNEARNLKDYIVAEALDKRNISIDRSDVAVKTVKGIPEQSNYCDCGLYLIGYIEEFSRNPRDFVTRIISDKMDEDSEFANFDSSRKRDDLRQDLLALNKQQEETRGAARKERVGAKATDKSRTRSTPTTRAEPPPARSEEHEFEANAVLTTTLEQPIEERISMEIEPPQAPSISTNDPTEADDNDFTEFSAIPNIPLGDDSSEASGTHEDDSFSEELDLTEAHDNNFAVFSANPNIPFEDNSSEASGTHEDDSFSEELEAERSQALEHVPEDPMASFRAELVAAATKPPGQHETQIDGYVDGYDTDTEFQGFSDGYGSQEQDSDRKDDETPNEEDADEEDEEMLDRFP